MAANKIISFHFDALYRTQLPCAAVCVAREVGLVFCQYIATVQTKGSHVIYSIVDGL